MNIPVSYCIIWKYQAQNYNITELWKCVDKFIYCKGLILSIYAYKANLTDHCTCYKYFSYQHFASISLVVSISCLKNIRYEFFGLSKPFIFLLFQKQLQIWFCIISVIKRRLLIYTLTMVPPFSFLRIFTASFYIKCIVWGPFLKDEKHSQVCSLFSPLRRYFWCTK